MDSRINSRGQIALWIIVGLALLALMVLLLLVMRRGVEPVGPNVELSPERAIEECTSRIVYAALEQMLPAGGYINPQTAVIYNGQPIEYICQHTGYYQGCIMQHPVLLQDIRSQLTEALTPVVNTCLKDLQTQFNERGYEFIMSDPAGITVDIAPRTVRVRINQTVDIRTEGSRRFIDGFDVRINHPVFELVQTAIEIANYEAKYCYFEYVGYMILYPEIDIKKTALADSTKLYTLTHTRSDITMMIATRSCAIPPGI